MLALWEYFWVEANWTPGVTPSTLPAQQESRGGGHKKRNDYTPLDADYWDVRERYLRRFVTPHVKAIEHHTPIATINETPSPDGDILVPGTDRVGLDSTMLLQQALDAAALRAQAATSFAEMQALAARISQLSLDISRIHQQYYIRATAILLLDVF